MRVLIALSLFLPPLILLGCRAATGPSNSLDGKPIAMDGYGWYIEPSYYKVWSDSSWEQFGQITTIDSTTYATVVDASGYEYYYSSEGYAGFTASGGSLILFDNPMPSLPDTLIFGEAYTQSVTFSYYQINDTIWVEQTPIDTGTVMVRFGTFNGCVHLRQKGTLSIGGQRSSGILEFWLAKGPSDIRRSTSGTVILMAYGYVNGQSWGESLPKKSTARPADFRIKLLEHPALPMQWK